MDYGHKQTDRMLKDLEQRIAEEYKASADIVSERINKHFKQFEKQDEAYAQKVKDGKMTAKAYAKWRRENMLQNKEWGKLRDTLTADMNNANKIAVSMINDNSIDAYALNMNYGTYEIESGTGLNTSFTLYDHDTVVNLMRDDPQIIPSARLDIPEDMRWNRRKMTSVVTQGILSGQSIPDIAKRLQGVTTMNEAASIRNARTYTTAAENKGRVDSYERAKGMGIDLKQEWMATLDQRTRSSHRMLDGEKQIVGHKFSNGCRYPGDPDGPPWEIYNCRCTLVAAIAGFDDSAAKRFSNLPKSMSYDEWKGKRTKRLNNYGYTTQNIFKPSRPRKHNFASDEEFQNARDLYKEQREKYDSELDNLIEKAASVERFSDRDDFVKWASEKGIKINPDVLKNIDPRAFNEASYAIDEMLNRFPEIASYNFEYFDGSIQKTTFGIGITDDGLLSANGGFNFNPSYFNDYKYGLREAFEQQIDGTLVGGDGTFSSLVRHEFGHNVQDYVENKIALKYHANVDDWRKNFSTFDEMKAAREKYFSELDEYKKDLLSIAGKDGSSEYSNTNTMELFAEGFSAYTSGEKTDFAVAFGQFLKRWY